MQLLFLTLWVGRTALVFVCTNGQLEVMRLLVQFMAHLNVFDRVVLEHVSSYYVICSCLASVIAYVHTCVIPIGKLVGN